MNYQFSIDFEKKYKRLRKKNIRLCNAIDETIALFYSDPYNSELDNHSLGRSLEGIRSIHIIKMRSNDYCSIYEEKVEKAGSVYAYFYNFGTHRELFVNT